MNNTPLTKIIAASAFAVTLGSAALLGATYPNGTFMYAAPPLAALPNPPPAGTYTPSTLDDVGLQAAINAAANAGGGTVNLAAGTYAINATVVPKTEVFIQGAGLGSTIVQRGPNFVYPTGTTSPTWTGLIYSNNQAGGIHDIKISNLTIDGNLTASQRASQTPGFYGFSIEADATTTNHCLRIEQTSVEIMQCGQGSEIKGTTEITLDGAGHYHDNGGGNLFFHNVYFRRAGDITVTNITSDNSGASGFKFAGGTSNYTNESHNLTMSNCTIQNNGYCDLYLTGVLGARIYDNTLDTAGQVSYTQFGNSNGAGVYMNVESSTNCNTFDLVNNAVQNTTYFYGFNVGASDNINISGNLCNGNGTNYKVSGTNITNDNNTVSGTVTIPAAPTGLAASAVSSSQINLSWTASSGASTYNVLRSAATGGPYSTIATGVSSTSYSDTGLAASTTYYYVVQAVNSAGTSGNSNEASATTQAVTAPNAPTGLTARAPHTAGQIKLSWTQSTSGSISSNKVYRSTTSGGPYSLVTTLNATTSYTDTGLTRGATYSYVVTAVNSSGAESAYSNQASATSR